jgi:hypothetical protein
VILSVERQARQNDLIERWKQANRRARRNSKLPVLTIGQPGFPGCLVVIHEVDLSAVLASQPELAVALKKK